MAQVGGSVTGMVPEALTCRNLTSGRPVPAEIVGATARDREPLGLEVARGDRIGQAVRGPASLQGAKLVDSDGTLGRQFGESAAKLVPADAEPDDDFGLAVAIDGDTVVGAGRPDAVYVFVRDDLGAGNSPPRARNDSYETRQDTVLDVPPPGVLANDRDRDGDPLVAELVSAPTAGSLIFRGDGSFVYAPNPNFSGTDDFTYLVSDGISGSDTATVRIRVRGPGGGP